MKEFIIDFYINSNEMSLEKIKLLNDILFAKNLQNSNSKTINMGKNRYLSYNEKLPLTTFILEVNTLIEYIFERHKQTDWFNAENYTNSVLNIVELYNTENFKTKSVPLSNLALERERNILRAIENDYIAGPLNKFEIDRQRKKGIYVENGEVYNSNNEKLYVLNFTSAMNNILDKNKNREKKQGKGPNFYEVFKPTYLIDNILKKYNA